MNEKEEEKWKRVEKKERWRWRGWEKCSSKGMLNTGVNGEFAETSFYVFT